MKAGITGTRGIAVVAAATAIVAIAGYLVLVIAAPALGPSGYATFASFWSAVYLAVGAIFGIQQETTRQVAARTEGESSTRHPTVVFIAISAGILIALGCLATSPLWAGRALGSDAVVGTLLICAAIVFYSGQSALAGSLAGLGHWRTYAAVTSAEGLSRLALVLVAVSVFGSVVSLAFATVLAMAVWLVFLLHSRTAKVLMLRSGLTLKAALSRHFQSMGGAAASAILVTGFPLILTLVVGGEDPATLGVVILVITLTRAPVLVPMNAFLGMLVARFSSQPEGRILALLRVPALIVSALCVAVALTGFLCGQLLIELVFGSSYSAQPWFIASAALVAGLVALLSLTGAAALAIGLHPAYLAGWLSAAAVSCAVLTIPIPLESRVILSLACGPAAGLVVHLTAIIRSRRRAVTR